MNRKAEACEGSDMEDFALTLLKVSLGAPISARNFGDAGMSTA